MKKKRIYSLAFAIGLIGFIIIVNSLWTQNNVEKQTTSIESGLVFADNGFFKIQPAHIENLAKWDNQVLFKSDFIKSPEGQALVEKRNELNLITILNQYVDIIKSNEVTFFIDRPNRPIADILNQYEIRFINQSQIRFGKSEMQKLAHINDKPIFFKDLKTTDYRWLSLKTQEFEHQLSFVKQFILKKYIYDEAKKQNQSVQDFIKNHITNIGLNLESYYIQHHSLPAAEVYLDQPTSGLDIKEDWTPHLGALDSKQKVILFDSFFSESGQRYIKTITDLSNKFPDVFFGFRPIFPEKDQIQRLLAEVSFCVWVIEKDEYWTFMNQAVIKKSQDSEREYYRILSDLGISQDQIRDCVYKQEYKEVVTYHLEYAKYLNLQTGPLLYLNGFLYTGQISNEFLEKRLKDYEKRL